jgi:hypothetical protein
VASLVYAIDGRLRGLRVLGAAVVAVLMGSVGLIAPAAASAAATGTTSGSNFTVTDGTPYTGIVGKVVEPCDSNTIIFVSRADRPAAKPADTTTYNCSASAVGLNTSATINWGDTHSSTGTLDAEEVQVVEQAGTGASPAIGTVQQSCSGTSVTWSTCTWDVEASGSTHVYAKPVSGGYTGNWSYTDSEGTSSAQSFVATVNNGLIAFSGVHISRSGNNATLSGTVTYTNPAARTCDFAVVVDWGDGTSTTTAALGLAGSNEVDPRCEVNEVAERASVSPKPDAATVESFSINGATHTYGSASDPSTDADIKVTYDNSLASSDSSAGPNPATGDLAQIAAHPSAATTDSASNIAQTSATLNGFVDPQDGTVSDCHFDWGTDTSYGQTAPCSQSTPLTNPTAVTAAITGLIPGDTYHFRLVSTTEVGTTDGSDQTFTSEAPPPPGSPAASTGIATSIATTGATLNGTVNPEGSTLSDCHFEYGATISYGTSIPCDQTALSGSSDKSVTATLTGLTGGTTYHFRVVATNPGGSPTSHGADQTFTTQPDCGVKATFDFAQATGCFIKNGDVYQSAEGTSVDLNGITLQPSEFGSVIVNTSTGEIKGVGALQVDAKHASGDPIYIYTGTIDWKPAPVNPEALTEQVTTIALPPETNDQTAHIDGLAVDGDLNLVFTQAHGATFTGNAWLPLPIWGQEALGITGTLSFSTKPGTGIASDTETVQKDSWSIFGLVGVKTLKVTYDPVADSWSGAATIVIPTPNQLTVGASLSVVGGKFHSFGASVDNVNIPIAGPVWLQEISLQFGVDPTTLGGSVGISFGPEVNGQAVAKIVGGFTYQGGLNGKPDLFQATGNLTLGPVHGAGMYFDYWTDGGGIRFGGSIAPYSNPFFSFSLSMDGAIQGSKFDLDAKGAVTMKFIDANAGGEVLISDIGAVGCIHLSAFGFTWSPGIGYYWNGGWDPMAHGCSVGPWQTLQLGQAARAASASRTIRLLKGSDLVQLDGATAPPQVNIVGPGGKHVSVPTASTKPYLIPGFQILQDPTDKRTWIAIQHGGGTWKMTPEPGSTTITGVRSAQILPPPKVSGNVTVGKGGKHAFTWHAAKEPGQKISFWETGKDVSKLIGSTSKTTGTINFTPTSGPAGRRTIEAHVALDGEPNAVLTVAHFKAAAPPKPAKAKKLTITAVKTGLKVSWDPVPDASIYLLHVQVTKGDGAVFIEQLKAPSHATTITDVNTISGATVTLQGESVLGALGPKASDKYKLTKPKKKKK